jgi:hypothetical protein
LPRGALPLGVLVRGLVVVGEVLGPAAPVEHAQPAQVLDLKHEQRQRGRHHGDEQPPLARGRADRDGGEYRRRRGDALHHLLRPGRLPPHQAAADEADPGDRAGQHVGRAVHGDDPDDAGARADQGEDPVAGHRAAQVALEAEQVGQRHGDHQVSRVNPAHVHEGAG